MASCLFCLETSCDSSRISICAYFLYISALVKRTPSTQTSITVSKSKRNSHRVTSNINTEQQHDSIIPVQTLPKNQICLNAKTSLTSSSHAKTPQCSPSRWIATTVLSIYNSLLLLPPNCTVASRQVMGLLSLLTTSAWTVYFPCGTVSYDYIRSNRRESDI